MSKSNLLETLDEAIEFINGDKTKARIRTIEVKPIPQYKSNEVKAIRIKLHLTQVMFAELMGVSIKTVEAWESGKNIPNGTAQRMLALLNESPELIGKIIKTASNF